jgi:hypothetical protein
LGILGLHKWLSHKVDLVANDIVGSRYGGIDHEYCFGLFISKNGREKLKMYFKKSNRNYRLDFLIFKRVSKEHFL